MAADELLHQMTGGTACPTFVGIREAGMSGAGRGCRLMAAEELLHQMTGGTACPTLVTFVIFITLMVFGRLA